MPEWDPIQYAKFIKDRTTPATDLANRLAPLRPDSILDLGCGPGNSTKVLKDRFPDAEVTGADNSREMLDIAAKTYPDTEFIPLDISSDLDSVAKRYDIVFSNACLQWVPGHRELLPKLMDLLRPGGTLAVQIPMQSEHPVHIILTGLVETGRWKGRFAPREYNNLSTEEYYDVLSEISGDFEIWETVYCHRMPSCESIIEWYKGTGLRPYLEQLTADEADEFTADVLGELKRRYAPRANGEIMFRFPRLFFTAVKG